MLDLDWERIRKNKSNIRYLTGYFSTLKRTYGIASFSTLLNDYALNSLVLAIIIHTGKYIHMHHVTEECSATMVIVPCDNKTYHLEWDINNGKKLITCKEILSDISSPVYALVKNIMSDFQNPDMLVYSGTSKHNIAESIRLKGDH